MKRGLCLFVLLLSLSVGGCALNPNSTISEFALSSGSNSFEVFERRATPAALVLPVEHDRQTRGPSCGAHALASVVNYWRGEGTMAGDALYRDRPPADPAGYSLAELLILARGEGLLASPVAMPEQGLVQELESGRPVLVAVRLPSIYVQQRSLPGGDVAILGIARNTLIDRAGRVSEASTLAMVDHYLLVVGYEDDYFVVVEPVMGYRTISAQRLARYRRSFDEASIVFSAPETAASAPGA